tara:strand:+ start:283 stop:597 length:315 start_codon:yes stop_codon:yes gene_type:complete
MVSNKQRFNKKYGFPLNESHSLDEIAKITKIPRSVIQESYNRGIGAYKNNLRSVRLKGSFKKNPNLRKFPASKRLSPQQWAISRVYSFIMKGKADPDLQEKYLK